MHGRVVHRIAVGALVAAIGVLAMPSGLPAQTFPGADWQRKAPAEAGIDPQLLKEAIDFAIASEVQEPARSHAQPLPDFGREPFGDAIGPIKERGDQTGVVVHKGYIVAEWGEPQRVDMTHSVTKSMLSSVVGVAFDRGMIRSIDDTVRDYVAPIQLYNPHPAGNNRADRMRLARPASTCSTRRTTARSPGTTCCGRPATGRARCGASPTGPTARATSRTNG